MQIILASAKTMNDKAAPAFGCKLSTPLFQKAAADFSKDMAQYNAVETAEILGCSQQIAAQNHQRFLQFTENGHPLPAVLAYNGQAYKHLRANDFDTENFSFAQKHLWITSFLYGLLRPLDGILPYRMEGKVELPSNNGKNMFDFWKDKLTEILIDSVKADDGVLVHLATEEFQHLFDWQRIRREVKIIQPLFYVQKGKELKMQAVWAKTCRGAMTRYIIENNITQPEQINTFSYEGFNFLPDMGETSFPFFVRA